MYRTIFVRLVRILTDFSVFGIGMILNRLNIIMGLTQGWVADMGNARLGCCGLARSCAADIPYPLNGYLMPAPYQDRIVADISNTTRFLSAQ
jgi:hypothetical protein